MANFRFASGEVLPSLAIHYRTLGRPRTNQHGEITNAVLLLHGTGASGKQFLAPSMADHLFGSGDPLSANEYFLIMPDGIGHGESSKPSDGLQSRFPQYGYADMIEAQHRLVTEHLRVRRLRLVLGTSMGGMHTWMWGERFPDSVAALVPVACEPGPVQGRNLLWRRIIVDAIKRDPEFRQGTYQRQPTALGPAMDLFELMTDSPRHLEPAVGDSEAADTLVRSWTEDAISHRDANDLIFQLSASKDYDPSARLQDITSPLLAINFADDELNPPELGVLDRGIRKVPRGQAELIPAGSKSAGHKTFLEAGVWVDKLRPFLETQGG